MAEEYYLGLGEALLAIAVYCVIMLSVGVYAYKRSKATLEDYFLSERMVGPLIAAFTMVFTLLSGFTFFGMAGLAYTTGLGLPALFGFTLVPTFMIFYFLLAHKYWSLGKKYRCISPGELCENLYGGGKTAKAIRTFVGLVSLLYIVPAILVQLEAMGIAVSTLTGGAIPYAAGVIALALAMVICIVLGGLKGVIWTDFIQGLIMFAIIWIGLIYLVGLHGGLGAIFSQIAPEHLEIPGPFNFYNALAWFSMTFVFSLTYLKPEQIQRIFMLRDPSSLRRTAILVLLVTTLVVVPVGIYGVIGTLYFKFPPFSPECDQVMPLLVLKFMRWYGAPLLLGAIAAIVTSADSFVLTASSLIMRDFIQPLRPGMTEARALLWSKLLVVILVVVGVIEALGPPIAMLAVIKAIADMFVLPLLPLFLLTFYWKGTTKEGALAGAVVTLIVTYWLIAIGGEPWGLVPIPPLNVYPAVYGLISGIVSTVIVSLIFRKIRSRPTQ